MKYSNRAIAVAYILVWLIGATTTIGKVSPEPVKWQTAWEFATVIAVGVFLGWQARKEAEKP